MAEVAVGLMARYPRTGKVKTRLARSVGDEIALSIYRTLLAQVVKLVTGLDMKQFCRSVFVTPVEDKISFASEYPGFDDYHDQQGIDLGERIHNAFDKLLGLPGIGKAMLIGADCPELTADHIRHAARQLDQHDLVLGPTEDGGYYLIGLNKNHRKLFSEIKWGTSSVAGSTIRKAKALGMSIDMLPQLRDLDDQKDFEFFDKRKMI